MNQKISSSQMKVLNRMIFVLSIIGMFIAAYVLQSFLRKTNIACLTTGCERVRNNPHSYIFGLPVPGFGLVGYSFIAVLSFLRTIYGNKKLLYTITGIAGGGFLFVCWFTLTEIFVIHAVCTWCAISAVVMTVIFAISLKSVRLLKA